MIQLLPAPNQPGTNNFSRQADLTDSSDRFLGRIDFKATASDSVFARYMYSTRDRFIPGWFGGIVDGLGSSSGGVQTIKSQSLVMGWTRVFSSNVVNEFRFSWNGAKSDGVQEPFGQAPPRGCGRARRSRQPAGGGRPHGRQHLRVLRRRGQDRIAELPAQVPAHEPVRVPEHPDLAAGQPRLQVRLRHPHAHEEHLHGRARHPGRPRLHQPVHGPGRGRLPARLRAERPAHERLRGGPAPLGDARSSSTTTGRSARS